MGQDFRVFNSSRLWHSFVRLDFFRFLSLFAVLTLLVVYQLFGGWRSVYTNRKGPEKIDAAVTLVVIGAAFLLTSVVLEKFEGNKVIVFSTFGALTFVLLYDSVRWLFPARWHAFLWRYEHSYKLISSLFAMLSALVGNTVRVGQPWSQILPSLLGLMLIIYFFSRLYVEDKRRLVLAHKVRAAL